MVDVVVSDFGGGVHAIYAATVGGRATVADLAVSYHGRGVMGMHTIASSPVVDSESVDDCICVLAAGKGHDEQVGETLDSSYARAEGGLQHEVVTVKVDILLVDAGPYDNGVAVIGVIDGALDSRPTGRHVHTPAAAHIE